MQLCCLDLIIHSYIILTGFTSLPCSLDLYVIIIELLFSTKISWVVFGWIIQLFKNFNDKMLPGFVLIVNWFYFLK